MSAPSMRLAGRTPDESTTDPMQLVDQLPPGAALILSPCPGSDCSPVEDPPSCALCGEVDPPEPWDMHASVTNFSRTPLAALLDRLCPDAAEPGARLACDACAVLLNTIDELELGLAELLEDVRRRLERRRRPTVGAAPAGRRQRVRLVPIHTEMLVHPPAADGTAGADGGAPAPREAEDPAAPPSPPPPPAASGAAQQRTNSAAGAGDGEPTVRRPRRNRRRSGEFAHVTLSELTAVRRQARCLLCGAREAGNVELRRHYVLFHRQRPYICPAPHCGKELAGKAELEKHWGYHLNDKPFQCRQCPKRFAWLTRLEEHRHVHLGTKPYSCEQCGKSFRQRTSLKYHVQSRHERRFPFECAACPKAFATQKQLAKHALMHTGERPHRCPFCTKAFTQRSVLVTHVRRLHKDGGGACTCGQAAGRHGAACAARGAAGQPVDDSAVIVEELNVALVTDTEHGLL